jgi:FKBP-type peptidyl-prolyl cis-trans isomerase FkpA
MIRSTLAALMLAAMIAPVAPLALAANEVSAIPTEQQLQSLITRDTVIGKGAEAVAGRTVEVHYTGWLYDAKAPQLHGKQFDSSVGRGPFSFPLGGERVIKGWDQGVAGMKVGGKRTLIIPGNLAYGSRGAGRMIGPDAVLVFDVELLNVK